MSRGSLRSITLAGPDTLGDCDLGLLALHDGTPGPVLTFSVGWEFVGVWDGRHCCAVLDRALLRFSLPVGVDTTWTVDELTWWSSSANDVVLVGLSARDVDVKSRREPQLWRTEPTGLARLRERV